MKYSSLSALVLLVILLACSPDKEQVITEIPQSVTVQKVSVQEISKPVYASGKVIPASEKKLSFKTGGIIKDITVKEGDVVKQGTLLATLDLSEIKPRYTQALQGFEKAKRDFERVRNLYADSVASLELYQDAQTALDIAESNLAIASFNLENSKITAPTDGVILKKIAEVKEVTGAGSPVVLFGSNSKGWSIKVGVSDRNITQLEIKDRVEVTLDAYPEKTFDGEISLLGSMANPHNGTYDVEIDFNSGELQMRSGYVAKVKIIPGNVSAYKIIPVESLVEGDGKNGFVFGVNSENRASRIPVKIAFINGEQIALESGPGEGTEIAATGAQYLTDNSLVKVSRK